LLISSLVGCSTRYTKDVDAETQNLATLSKVWGFAKYTHLSFLTGERCWDEELLRLIPIVRFANPNDVNNILYDWFVGLGDDGYDLNPDAMQLMLLYNHPFYSGVNDDFVMEFFEDTDNQNWISIQNLMEHLQLLTSEREINLRRTANVDWINEDYLGASLSASLTRFNKVQVVDSTVAPVFADQIGLSDFSNENILADMDYTDDTVRLLGLFRLWNAIKYFFPYLDIIDYDWNEVLFTYIPQMIEGEDRLSYESTLVTMASKLQDAHILFFRDFLGVRQWVNTDIFDAVFGTYFAPVKLAEAEGYLVVSKMQWDIPELMRGDIIRRVNDKDIDNVVEEMLHFLPYPNSEKALAFLVRDHSVLRQKTGDLPMVLLVVREGEEIKVHVDTSPTNYIFQMRPVVSDSHMVLEGNIGLINPSRIMGERTGEITFRNPMLRSVMSELADANIDGLIIDLRQPAQYVGHLLPEYLLAQQAHIATFSLLFWFVPGVFSDAFPSYTGGGSIANHAQTLREMGYEFEADEPFGSFFHTINSVVLMNEYSQSHLETTIMALSTGSNITLMGSNSIGANGNVVFLPLPGRVTMMFSGLGVLTPEGGQTQRIGLSSDIYVPRTVAGIRDGRDELMEAAIEYLLMR